MGTRVYVGNLPFDTDASQLRALFEEGGREVADVKIITDRDTGRPRGFAFVEMGSKSDAQSAITALNGREVGGRVLQSTRRKNKLLVAVVEADFAAAGVTAVTSHPDHVRPRARFRVVMPALTSPVLLRSLIPFQL